MDNSIAKAEKKIEILSEKVGASEEGTLWIKESMDPFSDLPRRPVGFPDLITGNSVVQVIKKSKTFTVGASPQDMHIFMDSMDTIDLLNDNPFYNTVNPNANGGALNVTAVSGLTPAVRRGGLIVRQGAVGAPLTGKPADGGIALDQKFLEGGSTRVIAKGFEIHNTTNKLNVGGSVTVYRDSATIPYAASEAITNFASGSDTISATYQARLLTRAVETLAEATLIPGSQAWEAKDGAYCVCTMAAQTNNPSDEHYGEIMDYDSASPAATIRTNSLSGAVGKAPVLTGVPHLFSPFFVSGAFFTGLPAGTELTVNVIWILERFVDASNVDLVVLAQPSPGYDPSAMELYSKASQHLPHGVKVNENADGDWIKNIADVLATFGVPGMPLVKGGVDLYNAFNNGSMRENKSKDEVSRVQALEAKMNRMQGAVVGSPSRSANGNTARNNQQRGNGGGGKPKPKQKQKSKKVAPSKK